MKKSLVLLFLIALSQAVPAQKRKSDKLVIITLDGYRWKELFRGADSAYLFGSEFTSQDSAGRLKKYWDKDINKRRKKLMPFFWNTIAKEGAIFGNRDLGNYVNVKNRYWFSYPGYNEMFTGYPDTLVNSNNYPPNPNINVLEFINKQPGYEQQVAAFTSWNAFNRILNKERCGFPVTAGYANLTTPNLTETQKLLNEQQHYLPKIFGGAERPDAVTFFMAKEYLKNSHPKVLQLSFIDTDAFGHQGKYDFYLDAAHYNDAMIADIWKYIQSDPFYKDQTTLFIAVDHGRGDDKTWRNHSAAVPHSDEIWFAVIGPDTKPLGEIKTQGQLFQYQYAKTWAGFLGFDFTSKNPIGEKIEGILGR
ncbi:MAG: hypothetical protein JWP81_984 [Ferruginibacter sp.]|nr:hypothetical protein [Ferruginibacter sp.]